MGLSSNDVLVNAILCINLAATLTYLWIILSEKRKKAFFSAPLIAQKLFVVLFVGPLFISPIISQNKYEGNWVGNVMGTLIMLVGLIIIMMAFFKIGTIPSLRSKSFLATTGIYGIVRHPIYSGTIMMFAGLGLLFEASLPLSYLPLSIFLYFIMTVYEEKGLEAEYGTEYLEYKKKVRKRLIPFIC